MAEVTRSEAQTKAVDALNAAESYTRGDSINLNRVEAYSALGLAWATLAGTLPTEAQSIKDRPFGEATSR